MIGLGVNKLWSGIQKADGYAVSSLRPELVFDFNNEYYRVKGGQASFANAMTFSRTSNATMVDSDGLIKWAPHNLITYSENFSTWFDFNSAGGTITANAGTAPDGSSTAGLISSTSTSAFVPSATTGTTGPAGITYTMAMWVKSAGLGNDTFKLYFDGAIVSSDLTATNEWVLYSFTGVGDGSGPAGIVRDSLNNPMDLYIWGAHLYRSDLGGMVNNPDRGDSYVPTTSSAVYLPRRGHHVYNGYEWVNEGVLAESEARTNLLTYSTPNINWTTDGVTITENDAISPDGNTNATKVIEKATTAIHGLYLSSIAHTASNAYTMSAVVKKGTSEIVQLLGFSAAFGYTVYVNFDLSDGTVGDVGASVTSHSIIPLGNDWYRCSITAIAGTTATIPSGLVFSVTSKTAGRAEIFAGSTDNYFYYYHAQTEQASTPSSLIPTNGSSVTRAAETFTIPSANLPWPTPQYIGDELVTNGTFDTDSDWIKGSDWTISGGVANSSGVSSSSTLDASSGVSVTAGRVYLVTADVVRTGGILQIVQGGTVQAGGGNITSTGTVSNAFVALSNTSFKLVGYNFIGSVDNVSVREINPLSVSIQMDGRMTYADDDVGGSVSGKTGNVVYYTWWKDSNNFIESYIGTGGAKIGSVFSAQKDGGVFDYVNSADDTYSPEILISYNIASRNGSTFVNGAIDGTALIADTTPTALADLLSTDLSLAYTYMGTIKTFRIWDRDIGDTGIAEATAPSLEPSLSLSFDSTESSFVDKGWSE